MPIWISLLCCLAIGETANDNDRRPCVLVVVGVPGTPEYGDEFRRWAELWRTAATKGEAEFAAIGFDVADEKTASKSDRERLQAVLAEKGSAESDQPLWIVLIGHGSYDGREAKFNLRGSDVSDVELAGWLKDIQRPIAVLNCASSSGPFLNRLSAKNRIVVTATRSGDEQNYARFGQYLAESISGLDADLDKDDQVSLLEAVVAATHRVNEFYKTNSRLATEHALIDDNGDRLGTPADWFRGVRATRKPKDDAAPDGDRARQLHLVMSDRERRIPPEIRQRRDQIELEVAALRDKKATLKEDDYYAHLEALMTRLAQIYQDLKLDQ